MCTGVIIQRDGLKPIHCESVRELARWFDVLIVDKTTYPKTRLDRMAEHCLCPIDIKESAKQSGYTVTDDGLGMYFIARKA